MARGCMDMVALPGSSGGPGSQGRTQQAQTNTSTPADGAAAEQGAASRQITVDAS